MMNHWLRYIALLTCLLVNAFSARVALAQDTAAEKCIEGHEKSQVLRLDGKLLEAQRTLHTCASEACPSFVRGDCIRWLDEVQNEIPTVIFETLTDDGAMADVTVYVEDEMITQRLDGRPVQLDPGAYTFRFEPEGLEPKEVKLIIRQGEKNKPVTADYRTEKPPPVVMSPTPAKPKGRPTRPITIPTYVFAGLAVVGAGAAVFFGLDAKKKEQDALDSCAPLCSEDPDSTVVSDIKQSALLTDIAIGVSAASAITAAVLFFTRPVVYVQDKKDPKAKPKDDMSGPPKLSFGFGPDAAHIGLSGRF